MDACERIIPQLFTIVSCCVLFDGLSPITLKVGVTIRNKVNDDLIRYAIKDKVKARYQMKDTHCSIHKQAGRRPGPMQFVSVCIHAYCMFSSSTLISFA